VDIAFVRLPTAADLLKRGVDAVPIFSPDGVHSDKGSRDTPLRHFTVGNKKYEKEFFFLLDFCASPNTLRKSYDYSLPLPIPKAKAEPSTTKSITNGQTDHSNRN
jgi:hypothetical protein